MLMPREGGGSIWGSRDYCLPCVPCAVYVCPCNKNGKCELPSKISIRGDGRCQTGVDFMEEEKAKPLKIVKPKTKRKKN